MFLPYKLKIIGKEEVGFTLLEVLVAIVILAISLLGMATGEVNSVGNNRISQEVSLATASAEEILEMMRRNQGNLAGYNNFDTNSAAVYADPTLQSDMTQWRTQVQRVSGARGQIAVTTSSPIDTNTLATITLTWTDITAQSVTIQTVF